MDGGAPKPGVGAGVGAGTGVGAMPPPGGFGVDVPGSGAPVVSMTSPHLSEFVMGSFQSLRSVRGRISYISLSAFG